ncbi:hypothetical protein TraAM80_03158 [Trypanosoma rangeli]|uniref:Uncharacterized protein n=1 Tax=Trypanosoma rangeli TaxID=5698 RepID=A0A422NQU2_TRYRA|nr:uncharacterized protein TraAM80_03158 [Trypanosoma rangeli]RNF07784.1 hypothetical protein TraAM80_03158 [Trypanosoma rangeli]|eukprot:RNF07784.1 hypothetical protein TraAM80_03158 [Trypanosoma rangeli]
MNVDDPFADDLESFDTVMAELSAEQSRRSRPPPLPSGASKLSATTTNASGAFLEGRTGRRGVVSPKVLGRQVPPVSAFAAVTKTPAFTAAVNDEPMPWEVDETPPPAALTSATAPNLRGMPSVTFAGESGRRTAVVVARDDRAEEDPLAFLEMTPSSATEAVGQRQEANTVAAAETASPPQGHAEDEEMNWKAERRDLLSSLDAVAMELDQTNSMLDTLQTRADIELTELETKLIEKQTELTSSEDRIVCERREYGSYHQRRLKDISDRTTELLRSQQEEVTSMEKERYESQLRALTTETDDVKTRIAQLSQQRELLLQQHRYDERGIFIALADEEAINEDTNATDGAADASVDTSAEDSHTRSTRSDSGIEAKMSAALRLIWRHHNKRLESLSSGVVQVLHQETRDVAAEVRKRHEVAYLQDAIRRKEDLGNFMQEFLQRCREFFNRRAEMRSCSMAALRQDLRQATEQLRLRARQRLESRMREVEAKMEEAARRFDQLALESVECAQRKAAAVRESDESVARSQRADLDNRCQVERAVTKRLQEAEEETLQKQLERMRRGGIDKDNEGRSGEVWNSDGVGLQKRVAQDMCTARAESIASKVRELESSVQQLLHQQLLWNQAHCVEGEGHSFLTDEELFSRMAVHEKEATVVSLLDEMQKRQRELSATRQRCGELRESIAANMQEDVQTVRQQRLTQESYHANIDLLRMAWEREQRELLQWGHELMLTHGDSATQPGSTAARTHLPTASMTTEMMERLAERNRAVMEERSKLRTRRSLLFQAMEKEHVDFVARQRETESCWAQMCEQLLGLAAEEEAVSARQEAVGVEIAKMAAMRELMNHDKELFHGRREEIQEEVELLKRELKATLAQKAEHNALQQQIAAEQTALAQKQQHLATEQSRLEATGVARLGEENKQRLHPAEKGPLRTGSPLSPGKTSLRSFIDVLQEVTDSDNILAARGKQQESQRLGREERSTLSHSIVPPSGGRHPSCRSSFAEAAWKTENST